MRKTDKWTNELCTLKKLLVTVIVLSVITGHEEMKDGEQNPAYLQRTYRHVSSLFYL